MRRAVRTGYLDPSWGNNIVVNSRRLAHALQAEVRKHVPAGSALYTGALKSYDGLTEFEHGVVDHAVQYVDGKIHTNGLENFRFNNRHRWVSDSVSPSPALWASAHVRSVDR